MWTITLENQHHHKIDLGTYDGTEIQVEEEAIKRSEKYSEKTNLRVIRVTCERLLNATN